MITKLPATKLPGAGIENVDWEAPGNTDWVRICTQIPGICFSQASRVVPRDPKLGEPQFQSFVLGKSVSLDLSDYDYPK